MAASSAHPRKAKGGRARGDPQRAPQRFSQRPWGFRAAGRRALITLQSCPRTSRGHGPGGIYFEQREIPTDPSLPSGCGISLPRAPVNGCPWSGHARAEGAAGPEVWGKRIKLPPQVTKYTMQKARGQRPSVWWTILLPRPSRPTGSGLQKTTPRPRGSPGQGEAAFLTPAPQSLGQLGAQDGSGARPREVPAAPQRTRGKRSRRGMTLRL